MQWYPFIPLTWALTNPDRSVKVDENADEQVVTKSYVNAVDFRRILSIFFINFSNNIVDLKFTFV